MIAAVRCMHSLRSRLWVWLISPKCTAAALFALLSVASCKVSYCATSRDEYDEFMTGCLQNVDRGDAIGECGRRATFLGYAVRVEGECPDHRR